MAPRDLALGALVLCALVTIGASAAPPSVAQVETEYLLGFIETSGCEFYRNGGHYNAAQAGSHLREKYAAFAVGGAIPTTERFIENVASRSSLSGQPYTVSCAGREQVPTGLWLREALAGYRSTRTSRESRDAP